MDFNLEDILATANQMGNASEINDMVLDESITTPNDTFTAANQGELDAYLNNLTSGKSQSAFYEQMGMQQSSPNRTSYNAAQEMEMQRALFEGKGKLTDSAKRVPSAILESIQNTPLNMNPALVQDNNIDMLGERAQETMARFNSINEQLEKKDKANKPMPAPQAASTPTYQSGASVDYALIKSIVKECLAEMGGSHCGVMLSTDEGFKFRDAEDNIFECKMTYIGKAKRKNK